MNPLLLLLLTGYCLAIFAASFLGGKLSVLGALSHTRTQLVMSLVAGFILGIALYHLLPHGLDRIPGPESTEKGMVWAAFGVIMMIALQRMFHFHQHDFTAEAEDLYHHRDQRHELVGARSVAGIAVGLAIHTITEGIALGASVHVSVHSAGIGALPGLGAFMAILLHKPLDAYSIVSMMRSAGYAARYRNLVNLGFALLCPVVALATFWGVGELGVVEGAGSAVAGYVLCFAAGAFLCIALSDLLPEIHFHSHDRLRLILVFLVGIGLAYALHFVEAGVMHGGDGHGGH